MGEKQLRGSESNLSKSPLGGDQPPVTQLSINQLVGIL
jgi:hypothetical protein